MEAIKDGAFANCVILRRNEWQRLTEEIAKVLGEKVTESGSASCTDKQV